MTSLAWWLLLTTLTALAVGILVPVPVLAYLALTILLWFIFEWFLFSFRSKLVVRRVTVEREVTDDLARRRDLDDVAEDAVGRRVHVFDVLEAVAETESDSKCPASRFRQMPAHGIIARTSFSRFLVCTMPPRRTSPGASSSEPPSTAW